MVALLKNAGIDAYNRESKSVEELKKDMCNIGMDINSEYIKDLAESLHTKITVWKWKEGAINIEYSHISSQGILIPPIDLLEMWENKSTTIHVLYNREAYEEICPQSIGVPTQSPLISSPSHSQILSDTSLRLYQLSLTVFTQISKRTLNNNSFKDFIKRSEEDIERMKKVVSNPSKSYSLLHNSGNRVKDLKGCEEALCNIAGTSGGYSPRSYYATSQEIPQDVHSDTRYHDSRGVNRDPHEQRAFLGHTHQMTSQHCIYIYIYIIYIYIYRYRDECNKR